MLTIVQRAGAIMKQYERSCFCIYSVKKPRIIKVVGQRTRIVLGENE